MKWLKANWRTIFAVVLTVGAIAVILLLAFVSGAEKPPTRSTNLLIAVVAAALQLSAGWMFAGVGRVDPSHAQGSARRLIILGTQIANVKEDAQRAFEAEPRLSQVQLRERMGHMSAQLSMLEEHAVCSIEDWRLIHQSAVEQAERRNGDGS